MRSWSIFDFLLFAAGEIISSTVLWVLVVLEEELLRSSTSIQIALLSELVIRGLHEVLHTTSDALVWCHWTVCSSAHIGLVVEFDSSVCVPPVVIVWLAERSVSSVEPVLRRPSDRLVLRGHVAAESFVLFEELLLSSDC